MTEIKIHASQVEMRPIASVKPYGRNNRKHPEAQIKQLAAMIKDGGWTQPIVIDDKGVVIAGHGRLLAAQSLELAKVPCVIAKGLSEAQKKAMRIADNRSGVMGGADWDLDNLKLEIGELKLDGFDLDLTGFGVGDLDELFGDTGSSGGSEKGDDDIPEAPLIPVARSGDVWLLGGHRLMMGDSTKADDVLKLLGGKTPDVVYTDPPYGVSIVSVDRKIGGDKPFGKVFDAKTMKKKPILKSGVYAPVAGDGSIAVAIAAIEIIKSLKVKVQIIWGGNYYADQLPNSSCWIVWDKDNGQSFFADAELAWTNQKTAVRIFKHTWNGLIKASEHGQKRVHPTQKPVALAEWCLEQYGKKATSVLDLFGGSGSTLIAAEKTGRSCLMMELEAPYIDVIIKRWEAFTGQTATHAVTGQTFAEVKAERLPV